MTLESSLLVCVCVCAYTVCEYMQTHTRTHTLSLTHMYIYSKRKAMLLTLESSSLVRFTHALLMLYFCLTHAYFEFGRGGGGWDR